MQITSKKIIRWIGYIYLFLFFVVLMRYVCNWHRDMKDKLTFRQDMKKLHMERWTDSLSEDGAVFPVMETDQVSFEDGYGDFRDYGGKRTHQGIDIMPNQNRRDQFRICSVSEGVVVNVGWLKLGGYRVRIRSPKGFYFYYAHLSQYARGLKVGQSVQPGDFLGYMGDTGYGKEGTRGKFPVHLHFGIYITQKGQEKSINPYPFLKWRYHKD